MQVKLRAKRINFVFVVAASCCTLSPHSCLSLMYYTFYIHSCNAMAALIAKTTLIHVHFRVFKAVIFSVFFSFFCVVAVFLIQMHSFPLLLAWPNSGRLLTFASCNYCSSFQRLPLRFFLFFAQALMYLIPSSSCS